MSITESQTAEDESGPLKSVVNDLYPKARVLLSNAATADTYHNSVTAQKDAPPTVQTSYLTGVTNFQNGLVNHHMESLIRAGLAEKVGKLESTNPESHPGSLGENVYQCTERGLKAAKIVDDQPIGESFDALRAELERQREELDFVKGVVIKVAVETGTFERDEVKEMMPADRFAELFDADD